jgi:molecular chaperone HtpG
MNTAAETLEFQSEARQVLDLMIHSVYSNPDIFLRELISNSSDALDKVRFMALTQPDLGVDTSDLHIRIEKDDEARTISVIDNGIGMSREEVKEYIGTIAKSGSREFLKLLKESRGKELPPELIGQFGVGFYSSFIVADKVTLVTRKANEKKAVQWESSGEGTYTLEETDRDSQGTTVTLHLKPDAEEENYSEYLSEWKIRQIVKKYSDYVAYPIKMKIERQEVQRDEEGKPVEGKEPRTVIEDETLNSMKAIWTRPEKEVTEEEYNEFYRHVSHDWQPPLLRVPVKAEGTIEFRALLFIPSVAPFDLFLPDENRQGVHLYIRRVFIMSDARELVPEYLRFIRGVVDSEDLPLNVSREILQNNRQVRVIRKNLVKKILGALKNLREEDPEKFKTFWNEFGKVFKEGIYRDTENQETLLQLCLFPSTHSATEPATLDEYIERMPEEQGTLYYLTGESRKAIEDSPHLEKLKDKGYEALLLTDPVDEIWVQSTFEYKGKKLQSVGKGRAEVGTEEEKKKAEEELKEKEDRFQSLFETMQKNLDEYVKEVRLSTRLKSSPACLVGDSGDLSPQLEKLLRSTGQEVPVQKRILEINPEHSILEKMQHLHETNRSDSRLKDYSEVLYGQAVLAEGGDLPEPARFSRLVSSLLEKAF